MSALIIPLIFFFVIVYGKAKKVNCYENFSIGAKKGFTLAFSLFPYIATIMISVALFRISGLTSFLSNVLSPVFTFLGMPKELCELIILRPFTGSGSYGLLSNIFSTYGPDSYISRCASTILGSSETIFYVAAVYFSKTSVKKLGYAIPVALFVSFVGAIVSCLLCRII